MLYEVNGNLPTWFKEPARDGGGIIGVRCRLCETEYVERSDDPRRECKPYRTFDGRVTGVYFYCKKCGFRTWRRLSDVIVIDNEKLKEWNSL